MPKMVDLAAFITALLALVVALGCYVSWRATRLDRLHARIEVALAALDAALVRRCASVLEVATSGLLDPAASLLLIEAEQEARLATGHEQRELAESRLSQALRAVWAVRETVLTCGGDPPEPPAELTLGAGAQDPDGQELHAELNWGAGAQDPDGRELPAGVSAPSRSWPASGAEPGARNDLLAELGTAQQKVPIARLFYNDSVNATINARKRFLARLLRLAGSAPMPTFFEMDDAVA